MKRFINSFALPILALVVIHACGGPEVTSSTAGNTNWLKRCDAQRDCGEGLSCACNRCQEPCTSDSDCDVAGTGSRCGTVATSECGESTDEVRICLRTCDVSSDCGRSDLECVSGVCALLTNPPQDAAVDADADPADTSAQSDGAFTDAGSGRHVSVVAGHDLTCATSSQGTMKCWGGNGTGQLGQGDTNSRGAEPGQLGSMLARVDLGAGRSVTRVALGGYHGCALLDDDAVKCWGRYDGHGMVDEFSLGDEPGEMGDNLPALAFGGQRAVVEIDSHLDFYCALFNDGAVKCWGTAGFGVLGFEPLVLPVAVDESLPFVDLGTDRRATSITVGLGHACAILDNGMLKCWGRNRYGALGLGDIEDRGDQAGEMGDALPAVDLGTGRHAVSVAAGGWHTCALLDDGSLKCWGYNDFGQLGLGDVNNRGNSSDEMGDALPVIDLGGSADRVLAGNDHTCAQLDTGAIKCWGANEGGQLGLGDTNNRGDSPGEMGNALPEVYLGEVEVVELTVGSYHNCAVLSDESIKCWGVNGQGALGLGDEEARGDDLADMGEALPVVDITWD